MMYACMFGCWLFCFLVDLTSTFLQCHFDMMHNARYDWTRVNMISDRLFFSIAEDLHRTVSDRNLARSPALLRITPARTPRSWQTPAGSLRLRCSSRKCCGFGVFSIRFLRSLPWAGRALCLPAGGSRVRHYGGVSAVFFACKPISKRNFRNRKKERPPDSWSSLSKNANKIPHEIFHKMKDFQKM